LEDLLHVARDRDAMRGKQQPEAPQRAPENRRAPVDRQVPSSRVDRENEPARPERARQNDQAVVLIRAMVNAAKADGQISTAEQQKIVDHFGEASKEVVRFLRDELAKPLDVREFAWSVPLGMEQQTYAISLMAVDVDSQTEAEYLDELAHGLRLPAEVREQLHQRYKVESVR
jgi:uncharacterized membrane protein YebE (DUF533 family)